MKISTLVTIIGNIGVFNTLTLFDLSKKFDLGKVFYADKSGNISISVSPGQYYLAMQHVKKTITLEAGTIDIKEILAA